VVGQPGSKQYSLLSVATEKTKKEGDKGKKWFLVSENSTPSTTLTDYVNFYSLCGFTYSSLMGLSQNLKERLYYKPT
jgi:hypothetical protein